MFDFAGSCFIGRADPGVIGNHVSPLTTFKISRPTSGKPRRKLTRGRGGTTFSRAPQGQLLGQHERDGIRSALWRFYDACAEANMRETTRLALTIETWWPANPGRAHRTGHQRPNRSINRIIKHVKRVACGFTNMDNYRRRITAHIAVSPDAT